MNFKDAGEEIALNAAMLRLFKGEYRDSGDRHSDALFVKEGLEQALADLAAARAEAERSALWAAHLKLHLVELQRKVADFVRGASPAEWRHKEPRIVGFGLEFEEMKRFAALKDPEPPPAFLK